MGARKKVRKMSANEETKIMKKGERVKRGKDKHKYHREGEREWEQEKRLERCLEMKKMKKKRERVKGGKEKRRNHK